MLVSKLAYHTVILATGSVTTHIEVSRLAGSSDGALSLTLQEQQMELEEGGDKAGLALAGGSGCGHAGKISLEFSLLLSSGHEDLCEGADWEWASPNLCLAWPGKGDRRARGPVFCLAAASWTGIN